MSCAGVISWKDFAGGERAVAETAGRERRESAVSREDAVTPGAAVFPPAVLPRRNAVAIDRGARGAGEESAAAAAPHASWRQGSSAGGNDRLRLSGIEERRLEVDWAGIVRRCLDGDAAAWAELVRSQHRRVYGFCYRFTGSCQDSEDLTQEVFLKVYGNLASFDLSRGSFQTWITTLTRNLLVDHFRRGRQQRATDSIDAGWEDSSGLQLTDRLADPQAGPHQQAASRELERMVQQALTRISPELRQAVILRDLQDLDYKEIAQVLRIPEGTVKSRISRGRAELARLLERNKGQVV